MACQTSMGVSGVSSLDRQAAQADNALHAVGDIGRHVIHLAGNALVTSEGSWSNQKTGHAR